MAIVHGVAGEWARVRGTISGLWPLFLGVFVAGFALALAFAMRSPFVGAGLFLMSLCWIVGSLRVGLRRVERYFKGARGEEKVAGILQGLPDGYHVFNDFVACGEHIDHVVVGPAGVFAVETKCWSGKVSVEQGGIYVAGRLPDRSPLLQAEREASQLGAELAKRGWTGPVTPILVFASDTFEARIAEIRGTLVINSRDLCASFATDRVAIPRPELERLIKLMDLT